MSQINFTQRQLQNLPTPLGKRTLIRDNKVAGLGLMVTPSGHKSYFWFRKIGARPQWKSLGSLADVSVENARGEASKLNVAFQAWKAKGFEGPSPLEKRDEPTFEMAFNDYVEKKLRDRTRAVETAKWILRKYCPWLKSRKLSMIRKQDMRDLHSKVGEENGRHSANRVLQLVKTVFNWSIKEEIWTGGNPASGISFFPEASRTRFLQPSEFPKFRKALDTEGNVDLKDFILLAVYCGARRSNLLAMKWEEIDFSRGLLNIPVSKNGQPLCVPLVKEALDILKERRRNASSGTWVFPSSTSESGHLVEVKRAWGQFRKRAGTPDLRVHDLRRTLGSWEAGLGTSLPIIGASLGHKSLEATQVYAKLNVQPVREAIRGAVTAMIAAGKKKAPRALPMPKATIPQGGQQSSQSPAGPT
jgi:integrase